jgi:hypothetical protein
MRVRFSGSIPKEPGSPESNEDKLAFSKDGSRLALCDGASESFDSKAWASILARKFVQEPKVDQDWIAAAISEYSSLHDFASMSWAKQAAFERGSFATLLGVEEDASHQSADILSIGDSAALLVSGESLVAAWPFSDPDKFRERPTLLSTISANNGFIGMGSFWTESGTTFHLGGVEDPLLVCMTDALSEWALRQALPGGQGIGELLSVSTEEDLRVLVERERAEKKMRIDDSTLIVLSFDFTRESDGLSVA